MNQPKLRSVFLASLGVLLTTAIAGRDSNRAAPPGRLGPQDVARLIQQLESADATAAERAAVALIRRGPAVLSAVQKAKADRKCPMRETVAARFDRVLAMCSVNGATQDGIKLGFRVNKTEVFPGDEVVFTTTVCNMTDKEQVLLVGALFDNAFEKGNYIVSLDAAGQEQGPLFICRVVRCGNAIQPVELRLPPYQLARYETKARYVLQPQMAPSSCRCRPEITAGLQFDDHHLLRVRTAGTHRFRLAYRVTKKRSRVARLHPGSGRSDPDPLARRGDVGTCHHRFRRATSRAQTAQLQVAHRSTASTGLSTLGSGPDCATEQNPDRDRAGAEGTSVTARPDRKPATALPSRPRFPKAPTRRGGPRRAGLRCHR